MYVHMHGWEGKIVFKMVPIDKPETCTNRNFQHVPLFVNVLLCTIIVPDRV